MSDKPKKEKKEKKPKKEKAPKMKQCPACHEEIPKSAKVCPHCAAKQKKSILPLILAAVLLLVIALGVSVFVFHFPVDPSQLGGKKVADSVLGAGMELSAKEEEAVMAVLEQCGFTEISEVTKVASHEGTTSYAVADREMVRYLDGKAEVTLNDETKTVNHITCQGEDVYISGHLIKLVTDFYLGSAQRTTYLNASLDAVKARLDLPELAVFPSKSNWQFTMDGNRVTVQSTVTVKDATGKEVTRPFVVEFVDGSFESFAFQQSESEE